MEIKWDHTNRGFRLGTFTDMYGEECSIQESSLATDYAIWIGIDEPRVKKGPPWEDVKLPPGASVHGRMHLNSRQVAALIPVLMKFVKTGYLEPSTPMEVLGSDLEAIAPEDDDEDEEG